MFFVSDAWAQAAGAPPAAPSGIQTFLQSPFAILLPMFAIMYFMVLRPQQQERKKLEQKIAALKKGDRVITTSGMYATVVGNEGNKLVLKIADDVKVEFVKSAIAQVVTEETK